jgi:O-antigen/teichoic acid export membrane protein
VIKSVGIEQWGLLTVSVSLISLLSVLQSSISGAAGKKMTDFLGKGDRDEYQRYFFATVQLTIAVCILIFFFLSGYFIFFIDSLIDSDVEALKIVFGVTSLNVLIQILSLPALAVLQSFNRIDYQSKATIFAFFFDLSLCLQFLFLSKYPDLCMDLIG